MGRPKVPQSLEHPPVPGDQPSVICHPALSSRRTITVRAHQSHWESFHPWARNSLQITLWFGAVGQDPGQTRQKCSSGSPSARQKSLFRWAQKSNSGCSVPRQRLLPEPFPGGHRNPDHFLLPFPGAAPRDPLCLWDSQNGNGCFPGLGLRAIIHECLRSALKSSMDGARKGKGLFHLLVKASFSLCSSIAQQGA